MTAALPSEPDRTESLAAPEDDRTGPPPPGPDPAATTMLVPLLVGGVAAVALGVYGRVHEPTFFAINLAGFSGAGYVKAWLASAATLLGVVQLVTALGIYGRLGARVPAWTGPVHRWSGRLALVATIPVVIHCLFALGFQTDQPRVLVHSLVGCLFYGAFVTKMLSLSRRGVPGWALPVLGGVVFTALVVLWMTSSLWLFETRGLKF